MSQLYVGFDRDGTLEMPGCPFPERLSRQFEELQKMGAKLFLASGKNYELLVTIADEMNLNPWMICAENGGHICIKEEGVNCVHSEHPHLTEFKAKVHLLDLPIHHEERKHSIWSKKFGENVLQAENLIQKMIEDHHWNLKVYSYPDGDGGLDVVPPGIDKTSLLSYIPAEAIICYIGDGENDLSLLENRRVVACTVANAKETVKKQVAAKGGYIASLPAGQGVCELLNTLFRV